MFSGWLLEDVSIKNRSLCSRGRGQKGRIWDHSVMKWLFPTKPKSWKSSFRILPVTRFRDTGGNKLPTIFPHTSVLSKPPPLNCNMGSKNQVFHENQVFSRFTHKCLPAGPVQSLVYGGLPTAEAQTCNSPFSAQEPFKPQNNEKLLCFERSPPIGAPAVGDKWCHFHLGLRGSRTRRRRGEVDLM